MRYEYNNHIAYIIYVCNGKDLIANSIVQCGLYNVFSTGLIWRFVLPIWLRTKVFSNNYVLAYTWFLCQILLIHTKPWTMYYYSNAAELFYDCFSTSNTVSILHEILPVSDIAHTHTHFLHVWPYSVEYDNTKHTILFSHLTSNSSFQITT